MKSGIASWALVSLASVLLTLVDGTTSIVQDSDGSWTDETTTAATTAMAQSGTTITLPVTALGGVVKTLTLTYEGTPPPLRHAPAVAEIVVQQPGIMHGFGHARWD